MRLEAGFIRLPMHELLGAADAADQKEAEQLLVATVHYDSSTLRAHRRQTADGASMEPRGCNRWHRWQMRRCRERLKQAKSVAVGCDQLPKPFHGKEEVDGSSPS